MNRNSGRTWINFKELRAKLNAEEVLHLYNIELKRKGVQHHSTCPLPSHSGSKTIPSFSVHLERGIFQCFGCKAKGNLLEFAALMEGIDPADGNALRKVAVKLQEELFSNGATPPLTEKSAGKENVAPGQVPKSAESKLVVNVPLDFELKGLESNHPYLTRQGYSAETIAHFGVGFCSRGYLKDRLAIPLHDEEGRLVGYAGRVVDERGISAENPRYIFPEKRERNGRVLDFDRSLFVYNGSRINGPCENLIVVQDFEAVWWLNQNGIQSTVALMGNECSEVQIGHIVRLVRPGGLVWVMCDGDEAGEQLAELLVFQVSLLRPVRRLEFGRGIRPADLTPDQVSSCFTS